MTIIEINNPKAPRIRGVKVNNDDPLPVLKPLPNWNFASVICGTPGTGKTSLLINLVTRYYKKMFNKVYLFSGSLQTLPDRFTSKIHEERIFSNLDNLEQIMEDIKASDDKCLLIFDDLMKEVDDNKKLISKLLANRRHMGAGCCVFVVTQKLNRLSLILRTMFDSVYFFSLESKRELNSLFDDYISLDRKEFDEIVRYAKDSKVQHPFLFIDKRNGEIYLKFNKLEIKNEPVVEEVKKEDSK